MLFGFEGADGVFGFLRFTIIILLEGVLISSFSSCVSFLLRVGLDVTKGKIFARC